MKKGGRSGVEGSVKKPAAGLDGLEEPPVPAGGVLDVEIIARVMAAFPPGRGDALRADGVSDVEDGAVEGEGDGSGVGVIGIGGDAGDFDGTGEEMQGKRELRFQI